MCVWGNTVVLGVLNNSADGRISVQWRPLCNKKFKWYLSIIVQTKGLCKCMSRCYLSSRSQHQMRVCQLVSLVFNLQESVSDLYNRTDDPKIIDSLGFLLFIFISFSVTDARASLYRSNKHLSFSPRRFLSAAIALYLIRIVAEGRRHEESPWHVGQGEDIVGASQVYRHHVLPLTS